MHYKTLREEVAIHIRQKILSGIYRPGDKIVESELAKELTISRAPIREALMLMENEGLVTYSPNRGCTVKILEPKDVWQMYLLRANLEILSVKLCSGKMDDKALLRMQRCLDRFREITAEGNTNECPQIDEAFHSEIVKATGLPQIYHAWMNYNGVNTAIFFTIIKIREVHFEYQERDHSIILECLKKQDVEETCKEIQKHYLSCCYAMFDEEEKGKKYFERLL